MNQYIRILDITDAERFAAANAQMVAMAGETCRTDDYDSCARWAWARVAALEAAAPAPESGAPARKLTKGSLVKRLERALRETACQHEGDIDPQCPGCIARVHLEDLKKEGLL